MTLVWCERHQTLIQKSCRQWTRELVICHLWVTRVAGNQDLFLHLTWQNALSEGDRTSTRTVHKLAVNHHFVCSLLQRIAHVLCHTKCPLSRTIVSCHVWN